MFTPIRLAEIDKGHRRLLEPTRGMAFDLKGSTRITFNENNRHSPGVQAAIEARATVSLNQ